MKTTTLLLSALLLIAIGSCKKKYRCICYDNSDNGNVVYSAKVNTDDRSTAEAECYNRQAQLATPPNYNTVECLVQ